MKYDEALAWLYSTQGVGIKLGLENIRRLLEELGVMQWLEANAGSVSERPRILHVAGTNGKGSVCAMLDSICRAAGYRTGLFTSPHLISFRERIQLNGVQIPEEAVAGGLTRIREIVEPWETCPTFFEIATALGLAWFQEQAAEIIVLETGLGGRLDSTNVVTPAVTIVTSIGMDHWQYLGNTIREIAGEKAGIIKPRVPAVSAPQSSEAALVLQSVSDCVGASLAFVVQPTSLEVGLAGSHQKLNAALAIAGLRAAGISVAGEAIETGLREVVWPGRFERIAGPGGSELVFDGAHNEAAIKRLGLTWREVYGDEKPVVVLGILRDKDVGAICRALAPLAAAVIATPLDSARSCSGPELAETVRESIPGVPCLTAESVEQALALACDASRTQARRILIAGSLFLVGQTMALLSGNTAERSAQ